MYGYASVEKAAAGDLEAGMLYPGLSRGESDLRWGFVRKVYGILAAQLLLTTVVSAATVLNGSINNLLSVSQPMREQTLSQPQLSTDSSGPAAQEPGASAEESGASAATTGSTADAKIPFRPRKIRKVSSEGDPQQVSSSASTKKAANSRAPLHRAVLRSASQLPCYRLPSRLFRAAEPSCATAGPPPPTAACVEILSSGSLLTSSDHRSGRQLPFHPPHFIPCSASKIPPLCTNVKAHEF